MNAVVVYESLWGDTAAVAAAVAEGLGGGARAMSTAQATSEVVGAADLIVAGKFGPLRKGELERARRWGEELAAAMG